MSRFKQIENTDGSRRPGLRLAGQVMAATMMLFGASCATTSDPGGRSSGDVTAQVSTEWRAVSDSPLTFYPRGYPIDGETSAEDGEWVYAGRGRFFVPKAGVSGVSRDTLASEVLGLKRRCGDEFTRGEEDGSLEPIDVYKVFVATLSGTFYFGMAIPAVVLGGADLDEVELFGLP